ncbi:MAG: hypothetical protein AUJ85_08130 [Elusimicrobia bacterium CG1_02_37_114]|nr:MAG: hypothetical protein AUJ85_08130 [Elusimicrobia bacterium CG1_02_37_114]PIV52320.1 MAG: type II toxin-antitoxin system mRNA interferase toxin, RelE/StbE family [Elusimicrobia bacterium CG02_land_8_20_14_3_00_37_13]PIZ12569.1 MAG: type II toxin-antitoxin system mRNA interferase toxin, RelE/StbE family [Elusimicrobia bacterium CG_4_10_14_0_8_um_filter_37_32]
MKHEIGFPNESIEKRFEKELSGLQRDFIEKIKTAIGNLGDNPRPEGKKFKFLRPPVAISYYLANYRLRVGNYRILYDIDDQQKKVILLEIRRRTEKTYK